MLALVEYGPDDVEAYKLGQRALGDNPSKVGPNPSIFKLVGAEAGDRALDVTNVIWAVESEPAREAAVLLPPRAKGKTFAVAIGKGQEGISSNLCLDVTERGAAACYC